MTVNSIFIDYLKLKSMVQNNIVWLTFSHYTAEKKKKIKVNISCIVLLFIHTSKKKSDLSNTTLYLKNE